MHNWGDARVDWRGIDEAASYIGENCRKWGRIGVSQYKEKYGTVRVYCHFGFYDLSSLIYPGYHYYPKWTKWMRYVPISWLNRLIVPIQTRIYRHFYKQAVKKWPHLTDEILCAADWDEYLVGLGYDFEKDKVNLEE
jgi:hypothetical protein